MTSEAEAAEKTYIAVLGCSHGVLDTIYETVKEIEEVRKIKVSLLICCGDFQGVRNSTDLLCMKLSRKERGREFEIPRKLYDFHRYYSGEKKAPITTIFIGGNHEASNFLQELPYGGWVAPNIYYLGYAGIINFGSIRIGGISGIYNGFDFAKGRPEYVPYSEYENVSVFHYRALEVFRLMQIKTPIDIMLSHDWPKNIHSFGDHAKLYEDHEEFRDDINRNHLGSGPLMELLRASKPKYWFAGHMHAKFSAVVNHEDANDTKTCTKFLALDRPFPNNHDFLQVNNL